MEINITSLKDMDCFALSHSVMEGGSNAGQNTWQAAKEQAEETSLLDTEEKKEAFREWIADFGAWSEEDIAEMDDINLNALFLQFIAGDVREAGADYLEDIDWEKYEKDVEDGQISGYFYQNNGEIYFNLCR